MGMESVRNNHAAAGYAEEYSPQQLMIAACAREIRDGEMVFLGVGIPMLAGIVAKCTHAPNSNIVFEAGGMGAVTRRMPWMISDNPTTDNALMATELWRVFGDIQNGYVNVGVLGGAQIDRYGNLNSTFIRGDGDYVHPRVRLPGSGGANDVACLAQRVVIVMTMQERRFPEQVDFCTSPGFLGGRAERERLQLPGGGPAALITDKAVFRFDQETGEMYLSELADGASVEEVRACVSWDLKMAPELGRVEPPTIYQVGVMKAYDPLGFILGSKTVTETTSFAEFCSTIVDGYTSVHLTPDGCLELQ